MITHTIESYWIPSQKKTKSKLQIQYEFQIFEFWNKHYMQHTFWGCLIRCANIKWIRWVLLKIQSGHDSVHRRADGQTDRQTDGQGETSILRWSRGYNNYSLMLATIHDNTWYLLNMQHIIPNSKRWDHSDTPSGGTWKNYRTHPHGWRWPPPELNP